MESLWTCDGCWVCPKIFPLPKGLQPCDNTFFPRSSVGTTVQHLYKRKLNENDFMHKENRVNTLKMCSTNAQWSYLIDVFTSMFHILRWNCFKTAVTTQFELITANPNSAVCIVCFFAVRLAYCAYNIRRQKQTRRNTYLPQEINLR